MPVIRSLLIAFSTYSRIPVPQVEWNEENRFRPPCIPKRIPPQASGWPEYSCCPGRSVPLRWSG